MFKNRVTLASLVIICTAIIFYIFSGSGKKPEKSFCGFVNPVDITDITISEKAPGEGEEKDPGKKGKSIELSQRDKKWFVRDGFGLDVRADTGKILNIFEFLNDSYIVQKVTKKESAYGDFDLSRGKVKEVVLRGKDRVQSFFVGKQKEYTLQFVRKGDDPYVYLVSKRIDLNFEPEMWFFKKILEYDFSNLEFINYTTKDRSTIKISHENVDNKFSIKDVPPGKKVKDLNDLKNAFSKIHVSKFVPRVEKGKTSKLTSHKLHFKSGGTVVLDFMKSVGGKKEPTKYFLDLNVMAKDDRDDDLSYLSSLSKTYIFELNSFDKGKYERSRSDFFEKKEDPKEKTKEKSGDKVVKEAGKKLHLSSEKVFDVKSNDNNGEPGENEKSETGK